MTPVPTSLLAEIAAAPERFDLFQALRLLDAACPDRPRLGESLHPSSDLVRIGQQPSLAFAPRAIAALQAGEEGAPPRLLGFAFGLFGPSGPLPLHLTEYAYQRLNQANDAGFTRFADMFHHRMASLLFRAWAEAEPVVSHDRPDEDRFGMQLGALAGLGSATMRGRDSLPDLAKLHFTGRLALHTRNPEGLQAMLADFLGVPVSLLEFVPQWIALPVWQHTRLGRADAAGLGGTAMLGGRLQVHHHRFRLVLGPLSLEQYEALLPATTGLGTVIDIVRTYIGAELGAEVNLVLQRDAVPRARLGRAGRLGYTTWLGRRRAPGDADDLVIAPREAAFAPSPAYRAPS